MSLKPAQTPAYPEEGELQRFLRTRKRRASTWHVVFQASTIVGVIALTALLYNILNGAFGYVAVRNKIDPDLLVLNQEETRMLTAPNVVSSEDDNELAAGIIGNPYAIGFFGYAYLQENQDQLKALAVNGVMPTVETVEQGEYLLSRPLFIYTTAQIMQARPQVADFINFYLTHVNQEIEDVGYFPSSAATLSEARTAWLEANGLAAAELPAPQPAASSGEITLAGSSTVFPVSNRIANLYQTAGYAGEIHSETVGSTAGFRRFCVDGDVDIANASRAIKRIEVEACRKIKREPLAFRIGTDAIAVIVSQENDFLTEVSRDELEQIFTTADKWSDVNPAWPDQPIQRYIPGVDSGTLDFFVETVFDRKLQDLTKEELLGIMQTPVGASDKPPVSTGKLRALEYEQLFYDDRFLALDPERHATECAGPEPPARCSLPPRSQENILQLVVELVVQPRVEQSWSLVDSLFRQREIEATVLEKFPDAELEFRQWLNMNFVRAPQSSIPDLAGVRTAILGSLWTIAITILVAFPIGVGAAIYLEEYASATGNRHVRRLNRLIQTNINNLAGVPSIIYGMLGLAIFVRALEAITSGTLFGAAADPTTANGRTILSAGLTLALLILPLLIINAQEAIRSVPSSLRQASLGLGATKWQTIWHHVLPNALPGILTGTILAISRAIGETAPLVVIGASTFITVDPNGPFSKFTTLPIQIYQWTSRPQAEFRNIAAAAIVVLLILLLTLNATAVLLRNRYSTRRV